MQKRQPTDINHRGSTVSIALCNAWNYSNRHTEMLKEKVVIFHLRQICPVCLEGTRLYMDPLYLRLSWHIQ